MSRQAVAMLGLLGVVLVVALLRVLIDRPPEGSIGLAWPAPAYDQYRLTALAAGAIVGAALGVSGVLLQALLRNPLASPFILGVSTGAGLGVMIAMAAAYLAAGAAPGAGATTGPAVAGALLTLGIVYALSQRRGALDPVSLLLIGVVVSTIGAAGIMFCQHLVPTGVRGEFTSWLMGRIPENLSVATLIGLAGLTMIGIMAAAMLGRTMDAAALGDDEAMSIGVALPRLRIVLFIVAGVLAAISVTIAGPIGFVGLIAPHLGRLIIGPRHGTLVWTSAAIGIVIVVGADTGRQALDAGAGRMPIGIFTALIGGPLFIWLLMRRGPIQ